MEIDRVLSLTYTYDIANRLTNTNGATYNWDANGNLLESNADAGVSTAYGYTGESTDASGMVYLRARYYSPAQGRFVSRDVWEADSYQPISYNKWAYVYNNPIIYTDPTGNTPAIVAALIAAVVGFEAGFDVGAIAGGIYGSCIYDLALAGQCGCEMQQLALSMTKLDWSGMHALSAGIIGGVAGAIAVFEPIGLITVGVGGIILNGTDIFNTYKIIKNETGLTSCTVSRLLIDVVAMVFSGMGIAKGVKNWEANGRILEWVMPNETLLSGRAALDKMYSISRPGSSSIIREIPGEDAKAWFMKIADPNTIMPHRNFIVAEQGGLEAKIPGGGEIFYRPITKSGVLNPAIDIDNVPSYPAHVKFHFP